MLISNSAIEILLHVKYTSHKQKQSMGVKYISIWIVFATAEVNNELKIIKF